MSNAPQNQNQPAQKTPSSSQGADNNKNADTKKVGDNTRKDEPMSKGGMKDEGCSSSDKKPTQGGCS